MTCVSTSSLITFPAGTSVRSTVTFAPVDASVVQLVDVTCRYMTMRGATGTVGVYDGATDNVFYADIAVPDTELDGWWQLRWESNTPSAKIVLEDASCRFQVTKSVVPNP